jgi:hypothetical protein
MRWEQSQEWDVGAHPSGVSVPPFPTLVMLGGDSPSCYCGIGLATRSSTADHMCAEAST